MAARLDGPGAEGKRTRVNFVFTDLERSFVLELENAVLHHRQAEPDPGAAATVRLTHEFFLRLVTRQAGLREMIFSDELEVEGSRLELLRFFAGLEPPEEAFAIVTP